MSDNNNEDLTPKVITLSGEEFVDTEEPTVNEDIVDALEFLLARAKEGELQELVYSGRKSEYEYYKGNSGNMSMITYGVMMDQISTYREAFHYITAEMNGEFDE